MAVPVRRELMAWAEGQGARLVRALDQGLTRRGQRLRDLSRALPRPDALTAGPRQRLDIASERLPAALRRAVADRRQALTEAGAVLRPSTLRARNVHARQRLQMLGRILRQDAALRLVRAGRRERLDRVGRRFASALVERLIDAQRARLDERARRFAAAASRRTLAARQRLDMLDRVRLTTGYRATLARGYAVVWHDDALVTSAEAGRRAEALQVEFADGRLEVRAAEAGGGRPARRARPRRDEPKPRQGSLF